MYIQMNKSKQSPFKAVRMGLYKSYVQSTVKAFIGSYDKTIFIFIQK